MLFRRFALFSLLLVAGRVTSLSAQSDILRGQVTGPDGKPLENVLVSATALETSVETKTHTNKDGRYTMFINNGDGDYMMVFTAIGFQMYGPQELKRDVDEDVLIMNVKLGKNPVMLSAIKTNANRQAIDPNDESRIGGIGSNDRTVDVSALPVGALGDLASLAATLPGVTFIAGADGAANTFSVLGLDASQNLTTLNGLNFDGSSIPSGATVTARVSTNPFSAAQGGFSGAQLRITTAAGTNFVQSNQSETQDLKPLQLTDAAGVQSGIQYNKFDYAGNVNGPLQYNHLFYAMAWEFSQQDQNLQTLLNTSPGALEAAGISADSVTKLVSGLGAFGVPVTNGLIPTNKVAQLGSGLLQYDWSPGAGHNFTLTMPFSMRRNLANNSSTSAVPTYAGAQTTGQGGIALRHSSNFFDNFFDESNMGVQYTHTTSSPYLSIPAANVLNTSSFSDGTPDGTKNLSFGGNPRYPQFTENSTSQLTNSTSWVSLNNQHHLQVGEQYVYTRFNLDQATNTLGTYSYTSLANFEANDPSSFTRTLNPLLRDGGNLQQSYFINDAYSPFTHLQLQLGVRSDIAEFNKTPVLNPTLETICFDGQSGSDCGINNSHVPNEIYWSPRFGFSYRYGVGPQIGGFQGASRGSNSQFTGGFGLFRSLPTATYVYPEITATGLPSSQQQLSCTGAAVPIPQWTAYDSAVAAIPTTCANGTAGTVFSNTAPGVLYYGLPEKSPVSNRAQLQWRTPVIGARWILQTTGTYSLNIDQLGTRDMNFNDHPVFTLADEDNRPVYAPVSSIVPNTGAVPVGADAITPLFSHVTQEISDARSVTKQIQFQITPQIFNSNLKYQIAYTYQTVKDHQNGWSTNTAGNPDDFGWARSNADSRHQLQLNIGDTFLNAVNFSVTGRLQSGSPYTPMVSGDIAGVGYTGIDRAFIFNPKTPGLDTGVVNGMTSLLASAQPSVRDCLISQMGTIAGRNTCESPWYETMSANISLVSSAFHLPQRSTVTISLTNPLTGLDAALHGWNNLHGWGQASTVDPNLLYVTGFNSATNEFVYSVNQRFGAALLSNTASRTPFQMTIRVVVNVNSPQQKQQLNLWLRTGRATPGLRLDSARLRGNYRNAFVNPFDLMLRQADSLHLTTDQSDSIAVLNAQYNRFVDTTWSPIVAYLAALPDQYNLDEAWTRVLGGYDAIIGRLLILGPAAKKIFTTQQLALIPASLALYLDPAGIKALRPGNSNGVARVGGFGGGGGGGGRGGG